VTLDKAGRVVIPKTLRDELHLEPGDTLELEAEGERVTLRPFVEFFNLLNRQNPGNNFVPDISALPKRVNNISNATAFCLNAACTQTQSITSLSQLRVPAGALGDFFGPGTTVGIPFAAQLGIRLSF